MLAPAPHLWTRLLVHPDGRSISVAWARNVMQGLHSVDVIYEPEVVRVRVRMGTRPGFWGINGLVVMSMIIEHTDIQLDESLRGRRVEVMV